MAWLAAALVLLFSMRFGARGLLIGLPLAALIVWGLSRRVVRPGPQNFAGQRKPQMTREEALRVLGLEEGASADAVTKAHRDLVKKLHPDQGGSSFLTQQVNEAKQVLLKR